MLSGETANGKYPLKAMQVMTQTCGRVEDAMIHHRLGADGGKAIAEALKLNAVLTDLNIAANNLDAEAGKAFAEALKVNKTLSKLMCAAHPTFPIWKVSAAADTADTFVPPLHA